MQEAFPDLRLEIEQLLTDGPAAATQASRAQLSLARRWVSRRVEGDPNLAEQRNMFETALKPHRGTLAPVSESSLSSLRGRYLMRYRRGIGSKAFGALLLAAVLLVGVADAAAGLQSGSQKKVHKLPAYCRDSRLCHFRKGRYVLGSGGMIPGLRLTLPRGWSSTENDTSELNLIPPGHPADRLFVWVDLAAVDSTGTGQLLPDVGKTPAALISWLTTNPDFEVVSPPRPKTLARRIPAMTLTIGVSSSANFGDPTCPSLPRCADLFGSYAWGTRTDPVGVYGIGYPEETQLFLARIKRGKKRHTLFVDLDATSHSDLAALRKAAHSVISSFRLPKAVTPG